MNKKIWLYTCGLDSYLMGLYLGDKVIEYQKVYFNLNSMYTNNELEFLSKYYCKIDYDLNYNLDINDLEDRETAHVPNRNLMMVTAAAAKYNADEIILGGVADDRVSDNNDDFYALASGVLTHTMNKNVFVHSPLSHKEKTTWVKELIKPTEIGAIKALNNSYSCFHSEFEERTLQIFKRENGKIKPSINTLVVGCLECPACYRRLCALTSANIYVPFLNDELVHSYIDTIDNDIHPNRYSSAVDYSNFIKLINIKEPK